MRLSTAPGVRFAAPRPEAEDARRDIDAAARSDARVLARCCICDRPSWRRPTFLCPVTDVIAIALTARPPLPDDAKKLQPNVRSAFHKRPPAGPLPLDGALQRLRKRIPGISGQMLHAPVWQIRAARELAGSRVGFGVPKSALPRSPCRNQIPRLF